MKRYVPIIIGIVALGGVLYVGNKEMNKTDDVVLEQKPVDVSSKNFQGKVVSMFEGENTLEYGFDIPETSTTTVEKNGALVKVTDNGASVLAMYVSFEGGRGYSPAEYITNTIVPKVKAVTSVGTTTIGSYEWDVVESQWSVWHVAKVPTGNWLLVIENKKADNEKAQAIIESISTK